MANNGKELVKVKKIQLKSVLWFNDARAVVSCRNYKVIEM
jgi:hypothetical protein